jgi:hypothetical protein
MKTTTSAVYLMSIFILGFALSCGGGSSATGASDEDLRAVGTQTGPRTSSDMNISPANMQTPDPMYDGNDSISKADSLGLKKTQD